MRTTAAALLVLLLLAPAALAGKEEALAKIEAFLDAGELDQAKRLIDHLLEHNPGDPDLLRLLQVWRVREGGIGPILEEEGLELPENRDRLREAVFRIVTATMAGNPEEWPPLAHAGDAKRAETLLRGREERGSAEEKGAARALLEPPPPPPDRTADELIAATRTGPDECLLAFREAERRGISELRPFAEKVFSSGAPFELRFAAAGLLLGLGDESPKKLRAALHAERPVEAVEAARVLLRHPGGGDTAVQELFAAIRDDDRILRAKPTLLVLTLEALGDRRNPEGDPEPGGREFLVGLLEIPAHRVDAARALGALDDAAAIPALLAYLRAPPPEEEGVGGGLGFLGREKSMGKAKTAEEMRPYLVGALAILRLTAKPDPR